MRVVSWTSRGRVGVEVGNLPRPEVISGNVESRRCGNCTGRDQSDEGLGIHVAGDDYL